MELFFSAINGPVWPLLQIANLWVVVRYEDSWYRRWEIASRWFKVRCRGNLKGGDRFDVIDCILEICLEGPGDHLSREVKHNGCYRPCHKSKVNCTNENFFAPCIYRILAKCNQCLYKQSLRHISVDLGKWLTFWYLVNIWYASDFILEVAQKMFRRNFPRCSHYTPFLLPIVDFFNAVILKSKLDKRNISLIIELEKQPRFRRLKRPNIHSVNKRPK